MKRGFRLAESAQVEIRGAKDIQQRGILPSRSQKLHDIRGTARFAQCGCVVEPESNRLRLPPQRLLIRQERLVKLPRPGIGLRQFEVEFRLLRLVKRNAPFEAGNTGCQVGPVNDLRNVEIERGILIRRRLSWV